MSLQTPSVLRWRGNIAITASIALVVLGFAGPVLSSEARIDSETITTDWPRAHLLIPELPDAPTIDGTYAPQAWEGASRGELRYRLGSNDAREPDTRFRIGHHDGVLYLVMIYDWPQDEPPVVTTTEHDGPVWSDDGGEIYFSRIDDLSDTRQLLFNLGGTRADNAIVWGDAWGYATQRDWSWDPNWTAAAGEGEDVHVVSFAIPLDEIFDRELGVGDAFRLNLVRKRDSGAGGMLLWSPMDSRLNLNPPFFGVAVLTGPEPETKSWPDVARNEGLLFTGAGQTTRAVTGGEVAVTLFNPLAAAFAGGSEDDGAMQLRAVLRDADGTVVTSHETSVDAWPQRFRVRGPKGEHQFEVTAIEHAELRYAEQLTWQPSVRLEAEDRSAVEIEGWSRTLDLPPAIGMNVALMNSDTRMTVHTHGRAVYLVLPPMFHSPGPWYRTSAASVLRYTVNDREPGEIAIATSRRIVPLAEDLGEGGHTVTLELAQGDSTAIDAFLVTSEPLAEVRGVITSDWYSENLTDVRADVLDGDEVVRSEFVRNPINGSFTLPGLEPGSYRLRIVANGWATYETDTFTVTGPGDKVDLGVISLDRDNDLAAAASRAPRYGRTTIVQPGDTFTTGVALSGAPTRVELISPYKTIPLEIVELQETRTGRYHRVSDVVLQLNVPDDTPLDMYQLRFTYGAAGSEQTRTQGQAVRVCEALPEQYHIAAFGDMRTWGQQTSEDLAKVGQTAELAGARLLLVASEINAPYVAGAFRDLRVPYLVSPGANAMGRWGDFFEQSAVAVDDGPLRAITFGGSAWGPWHEVDRLLRERSDATVRILLADQAYPPLELVLDGELDLLLDGKSPGDHPQRDQFPLGVFHLGPVGKDVVRWIAMDHDGTAVADRGEIPAFTVPSDGPSPLRAEYSGPNDGTADTLTARVTNDTSVAFPSARLRFIMTAGDYTVDGAQVAQQFDSDDGTITVIDVRLKVEAGTSARVSVSPR